MVMWSVACNREILTGAFLDLICKKKKKKKNDNECSADEISVIRPFQQKRVPIDWNTFLLNEKVGSRIIIVCN